MNGALEAISFAREARRFFLRTRGGFQHTIIEYVRNVSGLVKFDRAESNPKAFRPLIAPLACSRVDGEGTVYVRLAQGKSMDSH
jgi:CTP synthase (UTP-ammonia lyase)